MIHLDNYLLFLSPRSLPFSPPILSGEGLGDTGDRNGIEALAPSLMFSRQSLGSLSRFSRAILRDDLEIS